jgi:hypothetical protein
MAHFVEVPEYGEVEFPDTMSDKDIASAVKNIVSKQSKGGEQNEDQKPNQPEANSDRNAGREANEQVTPVGSQAQLQANVQLRPEDQGQRERNDQARLANEGQTENAQGGIQGTQAGQVLGSQVPAGNQEEVKPQETGVQAAFSKVRDFGAEALSSIGQSIYGSLAGIARTEPEYIELPSYGTKVKNPRYQESKDLVDFFERQKAGAADVEALGAKPITGVAKTAADVTGGLLKLPVQAFTGPLGMASMIGEAFGSHKDAVYQKSKAEGLSDEDALNKADFEATASTAATLPLYYIGGKVAGVAADKLVSETAPKLAQVATRFGFNAVANSVASAASRGVTAALAGENIADAMKDVDVPGVIQDMAFAAHSTATHFQEQVAKGNGKEAARDLPDHALEKFAQDANYAEVVAPEVKARAESRMAQQAEQTNLPETAKVLEVSSEAERITTPEPPRFEETPAKTITLEPITLEAPPLAEGEAAPSLPKEETQPPVSVAGEAPVAEQVVEATATKEKALVEDVEKPLPVNLYETGTKLESFGSESLKEIAGHYKVDVPENATRGEVIDLIESNKPAEATAEAQPTKPNEPKEQVKETSGLPTLESVAPIAKTAVKAEEGVAQRQGEGKEEVVVPEGARIAAAAYLAPDGKTYEGSSHLDAMEKAKEAGAITQAEIDAKQTAESRNTEEFGYAITLPDGTRTTTTREFGGKIAKASGQAKVEEYQFGEKAHSNEMTKDDYPEEMPQKRIGPGAAGIREFELRDIQQGAEIIKGYKDQTNKEMPYEDWKRNFSTTIEEGKYSEEILKDFYSQSVKVANEASKGKSIPEAIRQLDFPIKKTESKTSIANANIDNDRVNRGRPRLMEVARKGREASWDNAMYKMDEDPTYQSRLISELSKNPRAANDEEHAVIEHYLITKKNERDQILDRLSKGDLSPEQQADLRQKYVDIDDQVYGIEALSKATGTETARGLAYRANLRNNDFSIDSMRTKVRAAKNGERLTSEEEEKIKNFSDDIKKNDDEVDRIQKEEKDKFSEEDTKEFIDTAKKGSRKRNEKESPDDVLSRLKDVAQSRMNDYRRLASTIRKIAITFVDKGITEREPLLDAVHAFLKDEVGMPESWTRQETSDAICQYGIFRTLNKDATMVAFRKINGQLLELGKRKDILALQAPKKTGMERAKQDVEARNIARENRKLIKKYNIKTEDPASQLAGALESAKNKLKNEIEDLTARIKSGEQAPSRADAPTDAEIASLKEIRDSLKTQFEIIYGKPEKAAPSYEEQVAAVERAYAKLIEKKKEILANQGITDFAPKKPEVTSPKIEAQKAEIEELNSELKALRSADASRNEQLKLDSLNRQIEAKKKQIQDQVIPRKGQKYDVASLERTQAIKELEALRNQIKSQDWYIAARQQAAIDSYVARQHKISNEYLRRIEEEDFAPRQKIERVLDSREIEAKAKAEQSRAKFQKELAAYNYKNRTKEQKVLDFVVNFSRATMLSHITTLTKLTAASVEIAALKPLKATVGYVWRVLPPVREIAKLSPTEGGGKPSEDVRLFVNGIVEGIKDFPNVVKSGQTKIDSLMKEKTRIDNSILQYFGHLHKAMKTPVFTGEFKMSLSRYLNWMEKQGMDIHDPVNQKTAMDAAYQNAQRSIFSEDNALVNFINAQISIGKKSNSRGVRLASYALQFNIPIVKIPTNIIKQVFEAQFGTAIAGAKIAKAMVKGMDTLSPVEADTIMRQLKVGSIGLAMVAFGAMRPDMFGGFHLPGITEEDEDVPSGGANLFGIKVPRIAFDNPLLIAAQVGATARKYWDAKSGEYGYKGEEAVDFAMSLLASEYALVKETPLLSLPRNIEETMNIERTPENLGGLISDRIPGPIQDLAKALDTEEDGTLPTFKALIGINKEIIKRKPDGSPPERFLQTIQKSLPYLRKQVPEK